MVSCCSTAGTNSYSMLRNTAMETVAKSCVGSVLILALQPPSEGVRTWHSSDAPLWHKDYFELMVTEKQQMRKALCARSSICPEAGHTSPFVKAWEEEAAHPWRWARLTPAEAQLQCPLLLQCPCLPTVTALTPSPKTISLNLVLLYEFIILC